MNRKSSSGLVSFGVVVLLLFAASPAAAQISLGTAASFGVLGGSTVTNTGATTVNGNVGVSPGSAIVGFPPGVIVGGVQHSNDALAIQAQSDNVTAYNNVAGTTCTADLTGQVLGGVTIPTLTPGVYCFSSTAQLTGALTLNANGNPNALFLFKIGSTLTTASNSSVTIINPGGSSCNRVFWQVGSSATLGTGTSFAGEILALTSITLTTGATTTGRLLAQTGAVTLDTTNVNTCPVVVCPIITVEPPTLPDGTVGIPYNQVVTAPAGTPPITFVVSSGALPTGLSLSAASGLISGTPTTAGTFIFTITATDANSCAGSRLYTINIAIPACPVITLSPITLPPGVAQQPYSQAVIASPAGTYTYTIDSGALPAGLSLNPSTGLISGIPLAPGLSNFTIRATRTDQCTGARPYALTILAAAAPAIPTLHWSALAFLAGLLAVAGAFVASRFTT